jgi:hypothetical protein
MLIACILISAGTFALGYGMAQRKSWNSEGLQSGKTYW